MTLVTDLYQDSWQWADISQATGNNVTEIEERFYRSWVQIATRLACKSSMVAFEPINEPPAATDADYTELGKLNTIFLQALSDAGGFNPSRVVTLVGPKMDSIETSLHFVQQTNITNPWGIQFHYYTPCEFPK